jgi:hypothetical protein
MSQGFFVLLRLTLSSPMRLEPKMYLRKTQHADKTVAMAELSRQFVKLQLDSNIWYDATDSLVLLPLQVEGEDLFHPGRLGYGSTLLVYRTIWVEPLAQVQHRFEVACMSLQPYVY